MIELKKLSVGYGKKEILTDISCSFEKGSLTAVIGPNGSGKTTLIKTIANIIPALSGKIEIDGTDTKELSVSAHAQKTAYLAQSNSFSDMTVGELVLHGRFSHLKYPRVYSEKDKKIAEAAMKKMDIFDLSGTPLYKLSGGQRQKAYLAMALAEESDYILLDEPTTYLDVKHKIAIMRIFKELASDGKGVVAVLHDLSLAMEYADEIAVVNNGKLIMKATPHEVFSSGILQKTFEVSVSRTETAAGFTYHFSDLV